MPRLLIFAPCEKVIIAKDDNNPTLIAVLTEIGGEFTRTHEVASGEPIMVPMNWSIFSMWVREDADAGKRFKQVTRFVSPSGIVVISTEVEFEILKPYHRVAGRIPGIPVHEPGKWVLELFLHEVDQPMGDTPVTTHPLNVRFVEKPTSVSAS